jgi:integrase/recombinase XerC/integrase/recombinase XerD
MSLKLQQRGKRYRAVGTIAGRFMRLSLGTANGSAAATTFNRIERAIAEGKASSLWPQLRGALPPRTFEVLAGIANFREEPPAKVWTWKELEATFETEMQQRILLGRLADSTWERYQQTLRVFNIFLKECGVSELPEMNRPLIEKFKVWRLSKIREKNFSRGGRGLALDVAILHRVFGVALECEMIAKNPVRLEGRPGDSAERGAQPFTGEQLTKLRQAANEDLLAYLLLRWTGLRGSDAVRLTWTEIDWEAREINRLTQKRKKRVVIPISQELFFALEAERDRRKPQPDDRILVNPYTGDPMTRPRLYQRMVAVGKRAGVPDAHPHRYRDSFAVDMLARGASPYDVAKLLGDTVATVEKHYAPFVKELRDRTRRIMESGEGLEKTHCTNFAQPTEPKGRIQ